MAGLQSRPLNLAKRIADALLNAPASTGASSAIATSVVRKLVMSKIKTAVAASFGPPNGGWSGVSDNPLCGFNPAASDPCFSGASPGDIARYDARSAQSARQAAGAMTADVKADIQTAV